MQYLYKLKFPYGVHFGAEVSGISLEKTSVNCHCDTFFSAFCQEILKLLGENELNKFIACTKNGEFLFSDLLPYDKDDLYIPKPVIFNEYREQNQDEEQSSIKKKQMKKLQFIPLSQLENYFNGDISNIQNDFSKSALYEKNSIARDGNPENNGIYSVSVTKFKENCGLYFVVEMSKSDKEWFDKVLKSLSLSGIGGKRTSGYGQFEVDIEEDCIELDENSGIDCERILAVSLNTEADYYLTLSAFYPQKSEIEKLKNGYYSLIQRQGFVSSSTYADNPQKRVPTVMINAGSCFMDKFEGDVVDVSNQGNHPVYRYGKPIMIGINL